MLGTGRGRPNVSVRQEQFNVRAGRGQPNDRDGLGQPNVRDGRGAAVSRGRARLTLRWGRWNALILQRILQKQQ